ncbi:family transcriptional regulator : Two component transcriptional regulator, LuxR family OS=Methylocella silvestris (strain BL2 / DSM 15510 / NCIMB 13906) GN=Msil_2019 PE=4 SV=1: Response_reg: GerE [Gemmata massiliana]|uniref:Response regulatory domain-containing protein n=2 Tax=Gemmata massiliana TaxID=1210884 RepID=A0A6P2DG18_9BACT|nr:family transcriptional regulator : Two component transcriptional regulator, LuxR family OS=Methylocella silvestris (strain BL2 / DSM 15510 / NCIMB 13906) GN=Msil_2019 PE=4 SV=1: Response_reg: GerE [Gemmata massiliana]
MTSAPGNVTRVLVADPHAVAREGLKAILGSRADSAVVGEAADGPGALVRAGELSPDVVVMEADLPGLDAAQVMTRLRELPLVPKVLVFTACEYPEVVRLLWTEGASGYALKTSPTEQLVQAVRTVAGGGRYLDPGVSGDGLIGKADGATDPAAELSARETQVVRLIALGYSNKEIAVRLKLSVKTVETYKTRALEKLHFRSRVDIVRYATRYGWLTRGAPGPPLADQETPF